MNLIRFYRDGSIDRQTRRSWTNLVALEIGRRHGVRFELQIRSYDDDRLYLRPAVRIW